MSDVAGEAIAHVITPRTVNAIPMANSETSWFWCHVPLLASSNLLVPVPVLVPRANGGDV